MIEPKVRAWAQGRAFWGRALTLARGDSFRRRVGGCEQLSVRVPLRPVSEQARRPICRFPGASKDLDGARRAVAGASRPDCRIGFRQPVQGQPDWKAMRRSPGPVAFVKDKAGWQ